MTLPNLVLLYRLTIFVSIDGVGSNLVWPITGFAFDLSQIVVLYNLKYEREPLKVFFASKTFQRVTVLLSQS